MYVCFNYLEHFKIYVTVFSILFVYLLITFLIPNGKSFLAQQSFKL